MSAVWSRSKSGRGGGERKKESQIKRDEEEEKSAPGVYGFLRARLL